MLTSIEAAASHPMPPAAPPRAERLTINKEFESFDAFIHEYVTNISRTGVFIKSKSVLPVGTRVNLRFTIIMDDIETIEGTGEVVRVEGEPCGMGIVFRDLVPDSRVVVERLLGAPSSIFGEDGAESGHVPTRHPR